MHISYTFNETFELDNFKLFMYDAYTSAIKPYAVLDRELVSIIYLYSIIILVTHHELALPLI